MAFFSDSFLTKLFLFGGLNTVVGGSDTYTELIDLGEENLNCQQPAPLPSDQGTFSSACLKSRNGNPVMCGGSIDSLATDICKEYNFGMNEWILSDFTLQTKRSYPAYAEISDGRYWVLGGAVSSN